MKSFILRIIKKIFPHTYNIYFGTPDDMVHTVYCINGNCIHFSVLNKSVHKDSIKGQLIGDLDLRQKKYHDLTLMFFLPESVDRLIEHLKRIKANLEMDEAAKILAEGGTMEWVYDKELPALADNVKVKKFVATFKFPDKNEEKIS